MFVARNEDMIDVVLWQLIYQFRMFTLHPSNYIKFYFVILSEYIEIPLYDATKKEF